MTSGSRPLFLTGSLSCQFFPVNYLHLKESNPGGACLICVWPLQITPTSTNREINKNRFFIVVFVAYAF